MNMMGDFNTTQIIKNIQIFCRIYIVTKPKLRDFAEIFFTGICLEQGLTGTDDVNTFLFSTIIHKCST